MEGPHYQPTMSTAQTQGVVDSYCHNIPGAGVEFSCSPPGVPQQQGESSFHGILHLVLWFSCVRALIWVSSFVVQQWIWRHLPVLPHSVLLLSIVSRAKVVANYSSCVDLQLSVSLTTHLLLITSHLKLVTLVLEFPSQPTFTEALIPLSLQLWS